MGWLKKRVAFPQWGGGRLPNKSNSDTHRKIKINPLKKTNMTWVWLYLKLTLTGDFRVISITAFLALNNT